MNKVVKSILVISAGIVTGLMLCTKESRCIIPLSQD